MPGWACVTRYGGFGDVLQAASVFPELKKQGFKVAFNCHPSGEDLTRHDPNVDLHMVQGEKLIGNDDLDAWWFRMGRQFDKYVNLSGSVERSLLAHPVDREYFTDTWEQRHAKMNVNYLERTHQLAGVPQEYHTHFYASGKEKRWAGRERDRMGRRYPVILMSLSGSSVHKAYPYWDEVIKWILKDTPCTVVTVGDHGCQILEVGWGRYRRVRCRSGKWTIRQTLTFAAHQADIVVGTETGVMNGVGLEIVPKVLMLSHSSVENLSKHWRHTVNIVPFLAKCHPCHKMHLHSSSCRADPGGGRGAWCSHSIEPERVINGLQQCLLWRRWGGTNVDGSPIEMRAA